MSSISTGMRAKNIIFNAIFFDLTYNKIISV